MFGAKVSLRERIIGFVGYLINIDVTASALRLLKVRPWSTIHSGSAKFYLKEGIL